MNHYKALHKPVKPEHIAPRPALAECAVRTDPCRILTTDQALLRKMQTDTRIRVADPADFIKEALIYSSLRRSPGSRCLTSPGSRVRRNHGSGFVQCLLDAKLAQRDLVPLTRARAQA